MTTGRPIRACWWLLAVLQLPLCFSATRAADQLPVDNPKSEFAVVLRSGALESLRRADDRFETEYIQEGRRLGDAFIRFRSHGGDWQSILTAELANSESAQTAPNADDSQVVYFLPSRASEMLKLTVCFAVEKRDICWTLGLQNVSAEPIEIGDLAVSLPMNSRFRRDRSPNSAVLKHSFISGHGSYLFWMRPNSVGPYLMMTPFANTKLEYWDTAPTPGSAQQPAERWRRDYRVYIHSLAAGADAKAKGCHWRQPHTGLVLAPAGQSHDTQSYGFKFQWADDYDDVRQTIVDERLVDVHVVPGMTVPTDLSAQFALRSRESIVSIEPEFPRQTRFEPLGTKGDFRLYEVHFAKLGENRLTVRFGDGRHMYLEFFTTEPLETLIKKRAAFIARSQHRDPAKWYNGLISDWNMESQVLLSPDNYDRISGFRIYAVTCDDPGLCKPAFLAAKNAEYPVPGEIEALDYYIEHFVWGGLQRTT
jgi:hypothetical protein